MLELVTQAWAQLDWFHRAGLLAAALMFLWSVGPAMSHLKDGSPGAGDIDMSKTTIINNGGMQIGGQGNTQNNTFVNAAARYEPQVQWGSQKDGNGYVTAVRFGITPNRPWSANNRSTLGVQLSGPYESYQVDGFGFAEMAVMTQENKETGFLNYSTATAPVSDAVVIRFKSKEPLKVVAVGAAPAEQ